MSDFHVRILDENAAREAIPALCAILSDCVEGGASVGFMSPFPPDAACEYWENVAASLRMGTTLLFIAERQGQPVGTVQVGFAAMTNQPHRADLKKLLVHSASRGLGVAQALMAAAEAAAAAAGRTLLVLDTATGSPAESLYVKLGWTRAGVIPDYALFPDGRFCDTTLFYKRIGSA